ncbi:MAG: 2-dehydro-3-deoxygluconokinase [Haloarculaceae archaeon]|jgi:2-dehydro-3-deoxygluconokinase
MVELVTFGDASLQFVPHGHERLETAREARLHVAGTESGAAVAANALGGAPTWVSALPDSPLGRQVEGQLRQHGIDTAITWVDPGETRQGIVFRETGKPPREDEVWHDRENTPLTSASPGDFPMDRIQTADALFTGLSTPVLSEQAARTTAAMLRAAHGSGVTTAVDIDYQPGFRSAERYREVLHALVEHVDVLVVNQDHAREVLEESGQARELANVIAAEHDLEMIVITRGGCDAVVLHDTPGTNVMYEREAADIDPVDTTGQHAAFSGGFLRSLVAGDELAEALSYGVASAALSRTIPGPLLTATDDEVEHVVANVVESSR